VFCLRERASDNARSLRLARRRRHDERSSIYTFGSRRRCKAKLALVNRAAGGQRRVHVSPFSDGAAVENDNLSAWCTALGALRLDELQHSMPLDELAKHDVLAVEMRGRLKRDEEAAGVGVGSLVGHAQQPGARVRVLEVLI
jgi:hypothetical protein